MKKATAEKVADLLGLVEEYLEMGRPRKMPGKPRPEAVYFGGAVAQKWTRRYSTFAEKVSLSGALKIAAAEQGYSRNVVKQAAFELCWEAIFGSNKATGIDFTVEALDNEIADTRELQRIARRARKLVESEHGLR